MAKTKYSLGGRGRTPVLDGKALFVQYCAMGDGCSVNKLVVWAKEKGMLTDRGKAFSRFGIWWSMWSWAIRNKDEAKKHFDNLTMQKTGDLLTEEQWQDFLEDKIGLIHKQNKKSMANFKKRHGYNYIGG